jgi:hypothetical protein
MSAQNIFTALGLVGLVAFGLLYTKAHEPKGLYKIKEDDLKEINSQDIFNKIMEVDNARIYYNPTCEYDVLSKLSSKMRIDFNPNDDIVVFYETTKYGTQLFCYEFKLFNQFVESKFGPINPVTRNPLPKDKNSYKVIKYKDLEQLEW